MDSAELDRRFRHHPPASDAVAAAHGRLRAGCRQLADLIVELVPDGRERSLAITKLEEVMVWGNAGIARPRPVSADEAAMLEGFRTGTEGGAAGGV